MSYQTNEQMTWLRDLPGWLRHWHWHDDSDVGIMGQGLANRIDEYLKASHAEYICRLCAKRYIREAYFGRGVKPCDIAQWAGICCHYGELMVDVEIDGKMENVRCMSHAYGCGVGSLRG